jgi:hypothetical protein
VWSEVPRQDQHIVGPVLVERGRRHDGDVVTGREETLLQRAVINDEIENVRTDAEVVRQRRRLRGSTETSDAEALGPQLRQHGHQPLPQHVDVVTEGPKGLRPVEPVPALVLDQAVQP